MHLAALSLLLEHGREMDALVLGPAVGVLRWRRPLVEGRLFILWPRPITEQPT